MHLEEIKTTPSSKMDVNDGFDLDCDFSFDFGFQGYSNDQGGIDYGFQGYSKDQVGKGDSWMAGRLGVQTWRGVAAARWRDTVRPTAAAS